MSNEHSRPRDIPSLLQQHSLAVSTQLKQVFSQHAPDAPARLVEAMEYSLLAGGKRLRPALVLESFAACGAAKVESGEWRVESRDDGASSHSTLHSPPSTSSTRSTSALTAAAAMELIHTFSLVHDDLPAMDDDDLRRGRPTNHKVFGEAMAILAGDAMMTIAFEILAADVEPTVAAKLIRELAHASGPAGMIGGQVLDMEGENQSLALEQLQQIHRMKTGALLTTSCRMGAIAANAGDRKLAALTDYGRHMGLAFQIVDDILDVTATREQLGKATNKDADRGKNTYPSLFGLDQSRVEARKQLAAAIDALREFDSRADGLHDLARFIVERQI